MRYTAFEVLLLTVFVTITNRDSTCLGCRQVLEFDADLLECVSDLAEVIAVAGHPVKSLHVCQELLPVSID